MSASASSSKPLRLTKIVATLGPASIPRLDEMITAGVNVFRLNFSHGRGDYTAVVPVIEEIRAASKRVGKPVAILGDLQGPKFRIGELENHTAVTLVPGASLRFSVGTNIGSAEHIYTKNAAVIRGLSVGHKVLLDDGFLELKVLERIDEDNIVCSVVVGGKLGEKKGINVPDIIVSSKLSEKDKEDTLFAMRMRLDYIALSFVQQADDVMELRTFMAEHAKSMPELAANHPNPSSIKKNVSWSQKLPLIICKIEKPQAVDNIRSIMEVTDGIMVARGDMGVEASLERVPAIQKMLIDICNEMQKPVITATQMLETMIDKPVPTRAEVSDVANAVFDGTDCVMLSAESAVGQFPAKAVATMVRIIEEAERTIQSQLFGIGRRTSMMHEFEEVMHSAADKEKLSAYQTIARCAVTAARRTEAKAIVCISYSGLMANRIAKFKPNIPVIAVCSEDYVFQRVALLGGVHPLLVPFSDSADKTLRDIETAIRAAKYVNEGDDIVFCAGSTVFPSLSNSLRVYSFGELSK